MQFPNRRQIQASAASGSGATLLEQFFQRCIADEGIPSMAVIDFNATGEAGMAVTINGVTFTEVDVPNLTLGQWTNGASAADSVISLFAAINGDTRAVNHFSAFGSAAGDSLIVWFDPIYIKTNPALSETSAANCTVENAHGYRAAGAAKAAAVRYAVTAQDALAAEFNVVLDFVPTIWLTTWFNSAGLILSGAAVPATTITAQIDPDRLRVVNDSIAGNILSILVLGTSEVAP